MSSSTDQPHSSTKAANVSGVEYVVTEFEAGRCIAFHHAGSALDFGIRFDITPIDSGSCTVRVNVRARPRGWTRLLEPIMRIAMPKRGERITTAMVEVIEGRPAQSSTARTARSNVPMS